MESKIAGAIPTDLILIVTGNNNMMTKQHTQISIILVVLEEDLMNLASIARPRKPNTVTSGL